LWADETPVIVNFPTGPKQIYLGSNYAGHSPTLKHVVAPGENVTSTVPAGYPGGQATPAGTFASFNGTSMATPHVAGVVALMLSAVPNPKAPGVRDRVVDALRSTSQQPPPLAAPAAASLAVRSVRTSVARLSVASHVPGRPIALVASAVAAAAAPSRSQPQPPARLVVTPRTAAAATRPATAAAFAGLDTERGGRTEPTRQTRIEPPAIALRYLAASRLPRGLDATQAT